MVTINNLVEAAPVALTKKNQSLDSSLHDGLYANVYEGRCANNGDDGNNGHGEGIPGIPLTITLAYNVYSTGGVSRMKFRVAGGPKPEKNGSFELIRLGMDLNMEYSRGLSPQLLVKDNPYTIQPDEKDVKDIEQINKIMLAVKNEYR
jgi:hypothetical protein